MRARRWAGDAAALAAGAAVVPGFAPFGLWPLAVLAPAALFALWLHATPRRAAWLGWLFGFAMWGLGVYWIYYSLHFFGAAIAPLAAAITLAFAAAMGLLTAALGALVAGAAPHRRGLPWLVVLVPAAWVALEWIRSWLFTGFPWLLLGTALGDTWLAAWAPVIGVYGIGLLAAVSAGILVALPVAGALARVGLCVLAAAIWTSGILVDTREWTESTHHPVSVALVQGNIEQELKFQSYLPSLERYEERTRALAGEVDLVVWPETAVPTSYERVAPRLDPLAEALRAGGTDVVGGIFTRDATGRGFFNSIRPLGADRPGYHKQHLVPFGEYLPLRFLLQPLSGLIEIPMTDLRPGPAGQAPLNLAGTQFGGLVCYEAAYPAINRDIARNATAIINVSNDAWFGDSTAPAQHLQIARMRSMEVARPMLRATNTGISAIIDHRGRITASGPQFEAVTVRGSIDPRTGATPYQQWGEWPVLAMLLVMILGGVVATRAMAR